MANTKDEISFIVRRRVGIMSFLNAGRILAGQRRLLSVLCYHSFAGGNAYGITSREFVAQIEALKPHVDFVSVDRVMDVLEGVRLERPAVAITIDDGYRDFLDVVPFLLENKIPVTLFALSEPERVNRRELDHKGDLLTMEELRKLSLRGISIGSHGATHANFKRLKRSELREEIIGSKKRLEEVLGREVNYFAYPKGIYTKEAIEVVKEAGFRASFSVLPGCIEEGRNKYTLPRTVINKYDRVQDSPMTYVRGPFLLGKFFQILGK